MSTPSYCENGKIGLRAGSKLLHTWTIPTKRGEIRMTLHRGSYGFVLCHFLLWYDETIEPIKGKILDDWSLAWRAIRAGLRLSNHAGYAVDVNAMKHPLGRTGTMRAVLIAGRRVSAYALIRARLAWMRGVVSWGGDYHGRKDEMHYENRASLERTEAVARKLANTPRGRAILDHPDNAGQRAVIYS